MSEKQEHSSGLKNHKSLKDYLRMFMSEKILLKVPVKTPPEIIWEYIKVRLYEKVKKEQRIKFDLKHHWMAAASIIIICGLFYFINLSKQVSFVTQRAEISEFKLPDQSKAYLNANSKLIFKRNIWENTREVYLSGEAMFDVKKGSPFMVSTSMGVIKVLGTKFNVLSRNGRLKVSCFSGKVSIQLFENPDPIILTKGLEIKHIDGQSDILEQFDMDKTGGWRDGEFYYVNERLNNVLDEIERQFNVTILTENFDARFYTGKFTNNNLEEALKMVCLPMSLNYSIKDSTTIIIKTEKIIFD